MRGAGRLSRGQRKTIAPKLYRFVSAVLAAVSYRRPCSQFRNEMHIFIYYLVSDKGNVLHVGVQESYTTLW